LNTLPISSPKEEEIGRSKKKKKKNDKKKNPYPIFGACPIFAGLILIVIIQSRSFCRDFARKEGSLVVV
jgi:hypothetical protein